MYSDLSVTSEQNLKPITLEINIHKNERRHQGHTPPTKLYTIQL